MFAKSIIDSDGFMDLPFSSQAVYVHLAMRADDDGFVGNPKSILRMIGASEEDLVLLSDKGYVRIFDSSVVAIAHWKVNNYIQKDRYKPSVYRREKALMYPEKEEKSEEDSSVSDLDTQVRSGKDRSDKDRSGKDNSGKESIPEGEPEASDSLSDCEKVIDLYRSICTSLVGVSSLTQKRAEAIKTLLSKYSSGEIEAVFRKAQACDFLCGKGKRGWRATFDWLIREDNFLRVSEGSYTHEQRSEEGTASYDIDEYERFSIFDG